MKHTHAIRRELNLAIAGGLLTLTLLCMLALPAVAQGLGMPSLLWLMPAMALATPTYWALIHEAVHHQLLDDSRANARLGRLLSATYGAAFHVLAFAHLMHHRFNRQWESEWYDPAHESPRQKKLAYYATLLGGLYVGEVVASVLLALLPARISQTLMRRHLTGHTLHPKPELPELAQQYFFRRNRLREVRQDMVLGASLYAAAFVAYGAAWPFLAAFIVLRALMVSLADNAYHYATPLDNSQVAKELKLPMWMSRAMLHFNLHRSHHADMSAPWHALPQVHAASGRGYDAAYGTAIMEQFQGPLTIASATPHAPRRSTGIRMDTMRDLRAV